MVLYRYGRFCSAFPDLDMAFGSLGSFFRFAPTHVRPPKPLTSVTEMRPASHAVELERKLTDCLNSQGCYEANPPFVPCVIHRMARHMEALLDAVSPNERRKDDTASPTKGQGEEDSGDEEGDEESGDEEEEEGKSAASSSDEEEEDEEDEDADAEEEEEEGGSVEEEEEGEGEGSPLCFIVVIPAWSEDRNTRVVQTASERPWKMYVRQVEVSLQYLG